MKLNILSDKIRTIEGFLNEEECRDYIDLSESLGYEVATLDNHQVIFDIRNNDRVFYENQVLADQLFERAKAFLVPEIGKSVLVGLNERFRFYKYQKGHKFEKHQDGNFIRNRQEASYFTFMIYLNEGCTGGETNFLEHKISPKQGMALVFYHKLIHEGSEVLEGVKYVLRTDVMYRLKDLS